MFVTTVENRDVPFDAFASPGLSFWRLIELELQLPWFLVNTCESVGDATEAISARINVTRLVAHAEELVELCRSGGSSGTSVWAAVLVPGHLDQVEGWSLRRIAAIWSKNSTGHLDVLGHTAYFVETICGRRYATSSVTSIVDNATDMTLEISLMHQNEGQ